MKREELIRRLETRLAEWDERLLELEAKVQRNDPHGHNGHRAELRSLRRQRNEAEAHLTELRAEGPESWVEEDLGSGVLHIFDDIGARLDRLVSRLGG